MNLLLERTEKTKTHTIGRLSIVNELGATYFCDTLEPPVVVDNRNKPKAIPAGRYRILVTWSPKFERWLPLLMKVPYREGIRIHAGNRVGDTRGCILVGQNLAPDCVYNSRTTLEALMAKLRERPEGEAVWIRIEN